MALFGNALGIKNVTDAVDRAEGLQVEAVVVEEVADLNDVLVELAAADIGVNTPDGMNERLARDDRALVGVEVGEDVELLATQVRGDVGFRERDFEARGADMRTAEIKGLVADLYVFRKILVGVGFGAAEHGVDAGDEFGVAERLGDVIVAAHIKGLELAGLLIVAGKEDDGHGRAGGLELLHEPKAGLVGQGDVQEDKVGEILFKKFRGVLGAIADLRLHAGTFEINGDEPGELGLVFDDYDERFRRGSR